MALNNPPFSCPTLPVLVFSLGSGNSVFRASLCQSEYFSDYGEVLGNDHRSDFEFRTELLERELEAKESIKKYEFEFPDTCFRTQLKSRNTFTLIGINYESIGQMSGETAKSGTPPELINWLNAKQYPVVHLIRHNPLDCLVDQIVSDPSQFAYDKTSDLDVDAAVARISEMQRLVNRFRHWLTPANQIEFQFETLLDGNGQISRLVVHQFCGLLGLDSRLVKTRRVAPLTVGINQTSASRLKRQLRPAFIRVGYENLFSLPKAA